MIDQILSFLIRGTALGGIYVLVAIGFVLIFSVGGYENLFHGSTALVGGYAFLFTWLAGIPIPVCIGIAAIAGAAASGGVYFSIRRWPVGHSLIWIVTLLMGFMFQKLMESVYPSTGGYGFPALVGGSASIAGFTVTIDTFIIIALAAVFTGATLYFINYTTTGKSVRATALNREAAELWGVNTERIVILVWVIAGLLAAIGGVMYGEFTFLKSTIWFPLVVIAFAASVSGGIGSIKGGIIAALMIAYIETITMVFIEPRLRGVFAYIILLIIVSLRPQGLFGGR